MNKSIDRIGILTFHYSNNYGGVLQSIALYNMILKMGLNVEIINYVPMSYKNIGILNKLNLKRNILSNKWVDLCPIKIYKKIRIITKYSDMISKNFNMYREKNAKYSIHVNQDSLESILKNYTTIIVGSDQVWNPSQRESPIYFLNFKENFKGKKISYAADSTTAEVNEKQRKILRDSLDDFNHISVRNKHSFDFVKSITSTDPLIVVDPTLLIDFKISNTNHYKSDSYILTYILGDEIDGKHKNVIKKIKEKFGNLPIYSIKIPTMDFNLLPKSDKTFFDVSPEEWILLFKNAKFVYTDSYHGVLFALKYHKPFLAYYKEELRASRFVDLAKRYGIDKYIIQNTSDILLKKPFNENPDFSLIDKIIANEKDNSIKFLREALLNHGNAKENHES